MTQRAQEVSSALPLTKVIAITKLESLVNSTLATTGRQPVLDDKSPDYLGVASMADTPSVDDARTRKSPDALVTASSESESTKLPANTQIEDFAVPPAANPSPRIPSLRSTSDPPATASMTASSTPLGAVNAARRPGIPPSSLSSMRNGGLPEDMQAKMKAFHLSRRGAPPTPNLRMPGNPPVHSISTNTIPTAAGLIAAGPMGGGTGSPGQTGPGLPEAPVTGIPGSLRLPPSTRPQAQNWISAPAVPHTKVGSKPSLAAKRMGRGMKLSDVSQAAAPSSDPAIPASMSSTMQTAGTESTNGTAVGGDSEGLSGGGTSGSLFNKFSDFVDTASGTLKFKGKAVIHGKGIDFSSGSSFSISLDEVDNLEELGKGNYGTVYKVRHSRPQMRRPGLGLSGNRPHPSMSASSTATSSPVTPASADSSINVALQSSASSAPNGGQTSTTGIVMAMKEIRLELDEAKFAAIIMELDVLHRCVSPFIIDFYGAFFQEGAVYICMEYMDGGSVDKLYGDGIPEGVLRKITLSTVMGLKALKDDHNIIHRDVKPTNILVNSRGQVKICDFGVSGNLVASIAKTNIGCQSYMAPERISSGGIAQAGANPGGGTYSVQSDIWSLGLSVIECAMGRYPYPPETYNNIFSQLSVNLWIILLLYMVEALT